MKASEEISCLINKAENMESFQGAMYYILLSIAKMEYYLNKDKLDTIEVIE